jgi:hypothetical protein
VIAAMLFTITGITSKPLRGLMTGLLHRPCSMNPATICPGWPATG